MTASNYVVRFEDLRIADIPRVGGKNASLGEMIGNLAARGIRVPGGFATTAAAYRDFLDEAGLAERIEARLAALDPDDVEALARCGAEIRGWIAAAPLADPPGSRDRSRLPDPDGRKRVSGRRPVERHGRGPSGRLLCRPAGDDAQRVRAGRRARRDPARLRVALQRPRDLLSRPQGVHARRSRPVGRRAAHGAQRSCGERRDVHAGHRIGFQRRGVHHGLPRSRRDHRAGRGQSGRVLRPQADARSGQAPDHPPQSRLEAGEDGVHHCRRAAPPLRRSTSRPPIATVSRSPTRTRSSSRASRSRSSVTTAARWTSSGARTAWTASSTSSRRGPRR